MLRRRRLKSLSENRLSGFLRVLRVSAVNLFTAAPQRAQRRAENRKPQLNNPGHQEIALFPGRGIFQDRVQRRAFPDLVLPEDAE